jgi:hypothetical protein
MNPPKDIEPSALWLALTTRPRPHTIIDFPASKIPGGGNAQSPGKLALWVLTERELHDCRANAERAAKEMLKDGDAKVGSLGYEDIYRNELVFELVYCACRDAQDLTRPAFLHPKLARNILTTDEVAVLLDAYSLFRAESGPVVSEMTEAEMEAWIRMLQEGGSRVPLAKLSGEAKSDLILLLVKNRSTATGSAGSPPDAPSSESSNVIPVNELL